MPNGLLISALFLLRIIKLKIVECRGKTTKYLSCFSPKFLTSKSFSQFKCINLMNFNDFSVFFSSSKWQESITKSPNSQKLLPLEEIITIKFISA